VSANVGSLGGLLALKRNEAHLAGSHLLDPEIGEYNISYIHQYLNGFPVVVLGWVNRQQGLIVAPDNPKGIYSLRDLARTEVTYVNRQRGSGTRVLLDYHLRKLGVAPNSISGYNQEVYTHLAVAAGISSGKADCGLGIAAAAQALGLGFIPLYWERYDLVIPSQHYYSSLLLPLRELAMDGQFRQQVACMPGYQIDLMGIILAELE
jgi:putative molybdopterin biosynthesis protein